MHACMLPITHPFQMFLPYPSPVHAPFASKGYKGFNLMPWRIRLVLGSYVLKQVPLTAAVESS
jgi:hypothetical protein